ACGRWRRGPTPPPCRRPRRSGGSARWTTWRPADNKGSGGRPRGRPRGGRMTTLRRDGAVGAEMKNIRDLARGMKAVRDQAVAEVGRVVVGMEAVTDLFLVAMVGNGHVLLEGVPGVAKTTLSKTFARALGTQYQRIQFTPDLLPADVTGTY